MHNLLINLYFVGGSNAILGDSYYIFIYIYTCTYIHIYAYMYINTCMYI